MIRSYINNAIDKARSQKYKTLNIIEVSQKNIVSNFNLFKGLDPDKKIIAVLKANAYGHGLKPVATILNQTDCQFIAVDGYFEANKIKDITKHKVLVMGYILSSNIYLLDNKRCSFVLQDINSLKEFGKSKKNFKIHLEINTGMNRLGIDSSEIEEYLNELSKYRNLELEGVMTHLADADNPDGSTTNMQTILFDKAVSKIKELGFKPKYIHIAQSAGSTKVKSEYANTIRIGIGLYGINPLLPSDQNYPKLSKLKPALELKSTIIKVLDLQPGQKISYNGTYETNKQSKIAVLPLGYYEWVPREMSNNGVFTSDKYQLPIRGKVCMNHTMIDITGADLKVGDKITVISSNANDPNSIQNISEGLNLLYYELLTRLSESIRRVIV